MSTTTSPSLSMHSMGIAFVPVVILILGKHLAESHYADTALQKIVIWYSSMGLAAFIALLVVGYHFASSWAEAAYENYNNDPATLCDIDAFVTTSTYNTNLPNKLKVSLAHKIQVRGWQGRTAKTTPYIPVECTESPHVEGLWVARDVSTKRKIIDDGNKEEAYPIADILGMKQEGDASNMKPPVVIATIRMGFGHHRIAYSAASWAIQAGHTTIFHDFLNIQSEESDLIKTLDVLYSKFSRLASELGGPLEKLWGQAMKQGDADGLRIASLTANQLLPLLQLYPLETPIVCTHQICALVASAIGFTNVVNLVVDNYPQWFLVVPRTLNLTQGPVNYQSYLKMGVPSADLKLAGHWCPEQLVSNIDVDCTRRIQRAHCSAHAGNDKYKARRLVIPVGGAGAQKSFIINLIEALQDQIRAGRIQLFLNAGDHQHMKVAFEEILSKCQLEYDVVTTTQGVRDFQTRLLDPQNEPAKAITLFAFPEYFPAVATTDLLCRVSDLLTCKPSELAFYPIPKLHIRRVGDHEAYSAIRAAEVNDGSLECREVKDAIRLLELCCDPKCDLLESWNTSIMENHNKLQMYNGCKNAVQWAIEK